MYETKDINRGAERLYLGDHLQRAKQTAEGPVKYENCNSDSAILQASMVDALGAVFYMLVEAVRVARYACSSRENEELLFGNQVASYSNEACQLLAKARDQLIAEAAEPAADGDVGTVITPEAILINTMERIAGGVFGPGSIDVVLVFEECLEQSVSHPAQWPFSFDHH